MTRRTALQFVAGLFATAAGERVRGDEQVTKSGVARLGDFKITAFRFHLDPDVRLEVSLGNEIIVIPKDELIAALRPLPKEQETPK